MCDYTSLLFVLKVDVHLEANKQTNDLLIRTLYSPPNHPHPISLFSIFSPLLSTSYHISHSFLTSPSPFFHSLSSCPFFLPFSLYCSSSPSCVPFYQLSLTLCSLSSIIFFSRSPIFSDFLTISLFL